MTTYLKILMTIGIGLIICFILMWKYFEIALVIFILGFVYVSYLSIKLIIESIKCSNDEYYREIENNENLRIIAEEIKKKNNN